jgi:Sec-independent protein secretion pathway component TatC
MKTAAKVFIIIGMIAGFWTILPLIFGFIALKKLNTATCKADVSVGVSVLTILFVNVIGGILMLCLKDSDFQK